MPVFTLIKLLVLLDRNSNDGRTSMYRYFVVISLLTGMNIATAGEFDTNILYFGSPRK